MEQIFPEKPEVTNRRTFYKIILDYLQEQLGDYVHSTRLLNENCFMEFWHSKYKFKITLRPSDDQVNDVLDGNENRLREVVKTLIQEQDPACKFKEDIKS